MKAVIREIFLHYMRGNSLPNKYEGMVVIVILLIIPIVLSTDITYANVTEQSII